MGSKGKNGLVKNVDFHILCTLKYFFLYLCTSKCFSPYFLPLILSSGEEVKITLTLKVILQGKHNILKRPKSKIMAQIGVFQITSPPPLLPKFERSLVKLGLCF